MEDGWWKLLTGAFGIPLAVLLLYGVVLLADKIIVKGKGVVKRRM